MKEKIGLWYHHFHETWYENWRAPHDHIRHSLPMIMHT